MKLLNYLFTNKLSIRGWMWRCALVLLGLSIIGLIVGYVFVNQWLTTDRVISQLSKPEVITQIDKISNFLTGDQYIQISEVSGFVTNKIGIWFEEDDAILEIKLDGSCENWFTTNNKKGALITNQSICFRDTSKQQVVTWAQIMSGVTNSSGIQDAEISQFFTKYPSLGQMLSGGVVMINQQKLMGVESDIKLMTQDTQIISAVVEGINTVAMMMLIPLGFMTIFFVIIMTIVLLVGLIIYSLITRAIAGIMKYDIDFEQAFSLSWLPWMIVKIAGTIVGFDWYLRALIWIVMAIGLIYWYKQQDNNQKTHE